MVWDAANVGKAEVHYDSSILASFHSISHLPASSFSKVLDEKWLEAAFSFRALAKARQNYEQSEALSALSRTQDVPSGFAWEVYIDYRPETSC